MKSNSVPIITAVMTLAILTSCVFLQPFFLPSDSVLSKFNHVQHIKKKQMQCIDCHPDPEKKDKVSMPREMICDLCHRSKENRTEKYLAFVKSRKVGENLKWIELPATYKEAKFSHKKHLTSKDVKLKCEDCHGNLKDSKVIMRSHIPTMEECIDCHVQKKKGPQEDCQQCHKETRQDLKPGSHERSHLWVYGLHGDRSKDDMARCMYCHTDNKCLSCHQITPPKSHNTQWRHGGHGYMAQIDRNSCEMCHTQDSCVRCHQKTRPHTHTSSWGKPGLFHCANCHLPLEDNGCRACHQSTPDHSTAPQMPAFVTAHSTATDCFTCHFPGGGGKPIKHPYNPNAAECLICHKRP